MKTWLITCYILCSIALFAEDTCIQGSTNRGVAKHREHGGVGYDTGYTTLETFLTPNWVKSFQPFLDARGHILNNGTFATNLGIGMRYLLDPNSWALGGNFYFDFRDLGKQNAYQFGLGLEALSQNIDFRANGYIPFAGTHLTYDSPSLIPEESSLFYQSRLRAVLPNIDMEVGFPILRDPINLYLALGSYYLFGRSIRSCDFGNAWGGKTRLVARVYDGIELAFDTYFDRIFHFNPQGVISLSYPLGPANLIQGNKRWNRRYPSSTCQGVGRQMALMTQDVVRQEIIPIQQKTTKQRLINPATGLPYHVLYVSNTSGSIGTFEDPYATLLAAQNASKANEIIYVFTGDGTTTGQDAGLTMKPGQILQGSGHRLNLGHFYLAAQTPGVMPKLSNQIDYDQMCTINGIHLVSSTAIGFSDQGLAGTFVITNNIVENCQTIGIDATGALGTSMNSGVKFIENNQLRSNALVGPGGNFDIGLFAPSGSVGFIKNNDSNGQGGNIAFSIASLISGTSVVTVSGNTARNATTLDLVVNKDVVTGLGTFNILNNQLLGPNISGFQVGLISGGFPQGPVSLNFQGNIMQNHNAGADFFGEMDSRLEATISNNFALSTGGGFTIQGNVGSQVCLDILNNFAGVSSVGFGFDNQSGVQSAYQVSQLGNQGTTAILGGPITIVPFGTPCP